MGWKEFLLQKLYVQILSDVADEAFIKDPRDVLLPGERRATDITIGEVDTTADFIVVLRRTPVHPKYTEVWLEAPDGTTVAAADIGTLPNVDLVTGDAHLYFRVLFPAFPAAPRCAPRSLASVGAQRLPTTSPSTDESGHEPRTKASGSLSTTR